MGARLPASGGPDGAGKPTTERWSVFRFQGRKGAENPSNSDAIDPGQQPAELAADDGSIAEGADAGDVDVDRGPAVRTRLSGDRSRLSRGGASPSLGAPVFRPVP